MIDMLAPVIVQQVVSVYDGDTFTLANGTKIRLAGVDANEMRGNTCHHACAPMSAVAARDYMRGLLIGRTLTCQPMGTSYQRIVARCRLPDGRDLSCISLAAGTTVIWQIYWRRLKMGVCQ